MRRGRRSKAARRRFATTFGSGERVRWMQQLNCCACGRSPCEVAHIKSRGAGGTVEDTVPLCPLCHRRQHNEGIKTFAAFYGLDLEAEAAKYSEWWTNGLRTGDFDLGF